MKAIELLLTENVDNLGIVGDVVKVKPGYARNYLLPHGYATTPTQANIARLAERRREVEEQMRRLRVAQEAMLEALADFEITLQRSANDQGVLFGGVSQHDIAEAMREGGFEVDDRVVRIGQQIKRLDSYMIPIQLAPDLRTEIKLWVVSDRPIDDDQQAEGEVEGELVDDQDQAQEAEPAAE